MESENGTEKRCGSCKAIKPLSAFSRSTWRKSGLRHRCKTCENELGRLRRQLKPDHTKAADRKYNLKYGFGLTVEQYEGMLKFQNGLCAICHQPETAISKSTKRVKNLSVDHSYQTGEVRALLCGRCNVGIGFFRDSVPILKQAINYLEYHSTT